jgi:hypothetical protein
MTALSASGLATPAGKEIQMSLIILVLPLVYSLPCILGLILLDLVLGIGAAVKTNTFNVNTLPQFLQTQVLMYYLPIIVLVALAQVNWAYFGTNMGITTAAMVAASWTAITFYVVKILFANIVLNFAVIFGITFGQRLLSFVLGKAPAAK